MIPTPFRFEANLTDQEFQKLGQLSLRWSHIEHVVGNCLKVMLRLDDDEAVVVVFSLSLEQRLRRMKKLAKIQALRPPVSAALRELLAMIGAIQYVRNGVAHAIVREDEIKGHVFHLRSGLRDLTKAQIFEAEELTNYTAHVVYALRYALGSKDDPEGHGYTLPARPTIPEYLRLHIREPKRKETKTS